MQMAERVESGKSAAAAVAGGLVGLCPTVLTSSASDFAKLLNVGTGCVTCALFGVLYRYVVAADPDNGQIKGGAVAAFGLTRGLVLVQSALAGVDRIDAEVAVSQALLLGQSLLMVTFAAAALEAALKAGWVLPLGAAGEDAIASIGGQSGERGT